MSLQDATRQKSRQQLELPLGGRGEAPTAERSGEASRAATGDARSGTDHLLEAVVESKAEIVIIDITGVPTVDTLVAQHLLKTAAAAKLMGAECIISGIRPQIAQTIVHLGVELVGAVTKATLADAILYALRQNGWAITRGRG